MMRVVGKVPFVSGHTLFLTYAIMGPASPVTRITDSLVMLEVIYLKYFVWHDPVTSSAGITLGAIAALMSHWLTLKRDKFHESHDITLTTIRDISWIAS